MLGILRGDLRKLNTEAFDVLITGLASRDQETQGYAAFALGFSGVRPAMAPLAAAAGHPEESVRGNAIVALGQLGFNDTPMEPFHQLLADPAPDVRQAALYGLSLLVTDRDDHGMLEAVHKSLGDADLNVRNEALIVVRRMRRRESVVPILGGPIRDPEPLIRSNAALALGAMGREAREATPYLVELLKDEVSRVVESAWMALNKINEKDFDRSYATWRDWYEDEQKMVYTCLEHKDVIETSPGECPKCRKKLERMPREGVRRIELAPSPLPGLYVCPDHPEVITTVPAKCGKPGCGKDLVAKKPEPVIYTCPEHPEIVTSTPAKCGKPGCGKDLVPKK